MSGLADILTSFEDLDPSDRLEWLIEFGNSLPVLPDAYHAERNAGKHIVHECQAPVFFKVEIVNELLSIQADVPREAPIARGFASLLRNAFDGAPSELLQSAPANMLEALHLSGLIGMQRTRGLTAIYKVLQSAA